MKNWLICPGEGTDPRILRWITCPLQNLFTYPSEVGYKKETYVDLHLICQGPFFLCLNFELPQWIRDIAKEQFNKPQITHYTFRIGTRYDKNNKIMIRPEVISKFTYMALYY